MMSELPLSNFLLEDQKVEAEWNTRMYELEQVRFGLLYLCPEGGPQQGDYVQADQA